MGKKKNVRTPIPAEIAEQIMAEAGSKCSMPKCETTEGLEIHHIDSDPSNHKPSNLLVLCASCHARTRTGEIDRKSCRTIKQSQTVENASPDQLKQIRDDIAFEVRKLVGSYDYPYPFVEGDMETRMPDARVEAAMTQALAFEKAGIGLPTDVLRALSLSLFKSGEYDCALNMYSLVIKAEDVTPGDYTNYAVLLNELDREDEAEQAYRKAIEIDPENADWRNTLAYFLWEKGRFDDSEAEVRKALELDPDEAYANATLGLLMFEKNDLEGGRKGYEHAIELRSDDKPLQQKYHFEYARALARNGKTEEARKEYEAAMNVDATYISHEEIEEELAKLG